VSAKICANSFFAWSKENPTWGAPRIYGELKMLGFDIAESGGKDYRDAKARRSA
jgi:hypothetical protein